MHKTLVIITLCLFSGCSGPRAIFEIEESVFIAPASIQVKNLSQKADQFEWRFENVLISNEKNPVVTFLHSGNYKIRLNASRGNKISYFSKTIQVLPPKNCLVEIKTNLGSLIVILYDETPLHRDNFIKLAENGFYEGILFHRVINGFMIQGGDPDSKNAKQGIRLGNGGPGYNLPSEIQTTHFHVKGAMAAARTGDEINPQKESSGSQFYIVHGRQVDESNIDIYAAQKGVYYDPDTRKTYLTDGGAPQLDMEYTIFGQVINGIEIIDYIASQPTDVHDRPREDVIVLKVTVIK